MSRVSIASIDPGRGGCRVGASTSCLSPERPDGKHCLTFCWRRVSMNRRFGIALIVFGVLGIATATAASPSPTTTDLVRSTIDVPSSAESKEGSDLAVQGEHLSGGCCPVLVQQSRRHICGRGKVGAVTVHRGDAKSCTSQAYSAGQGYFRAARRISPHPQRRLGTGGDLRGSVSHSPLEPRHRADAKNPGGGPTVPMPSRGTRRRRRPTWLGPRSRFRARSKPKRPPTWRYR